MGQTPTLRDLATDEVEELKAGLRSPKAFTLRRCQILLASAQGLTPSQFAVTIGCTTAMVRNVISDFHERGVTCVHQERHKEGALPRGRPRTEDKDPSLLPDLEQLLADELAGSPVSEQTWVRSSSRKLRDKLKEKGHQVSYCTVIRLLRKLKLSLRSNRKRRGGSQSPGRDEQFQYIASQKKRSKESGIPCVSIDTKQKVLIGNFLRPGKCWGKQATEVNDHDFTSMADCRAVPFGIYDLLRNEGHVTVGVSNDTPAFAVSALAKWWERVGSAAYPGATELLILADCGGTNGPRFKAWHLNLQEKFCDRFGVTVVVCHYPPGCSKWNPIERLLFSQISISWAGKPLKTLGIMLGYILGTTTSTGLKVTAHLDEDTYRKGQKVTPEEMARLDLRRHDDCPQWNYTLSPRKQPGTKECVS